MSGFESFLSTPATGPTYTDLARRVSELEEQVSSKDREIGALKNDLRHARETTQRLIAGQQLASEARQAAFLEFAEDLAAMEPAARDAAIRRIIDNHQ